jgi:MOSC domain-containing protein YiiM
VSGKVEAVFVCSVGGAPMQRVDSAYAVAGVGLQGDRYAKRTGYWSGVDECQVTLIEGEVLDAITADSGIAVLDGQHRRNLVTRGVSMRALLGKRFRVGEAVLEYDRPRPPCAYIQSITEKGMTRALGGMRGGICVRVVVAGAINAGDPLEIVE